ncbi:OLC1v1023896C1 [Oldenlandia corymbosa var. corymbosa]|uniref:OLC1v1023896C1 n=1 Tax=Oldenlandia corymbosa var. corymbosa TaxID=529605 RepID=A0AAV1C3I3_OLDCO|nr:OLC1v1023896C1 [Oldenlandia corymbosa var. corymbosa]
MEEEEEGSMKWNFKGDEIMKKASSWTIRTILKTLIANLKGADDPTRPVIQLAHGDPSVFPSFRPSKVLEDGLIEAVQSAKFNCYGPSNGIPQARRAVAEYLSKNQQLEVSVDDVHLTAGGRHAIDVLLTALAHPGANILLPKPGYPFYEARATFSRLEIRHYDLLGEQAWEVDLHHVETLADKSTVAIVITNPGNPCGNVYTYEHLQKIAETARKHGFLVIADEAYANLDFGSTPFVSMQHFGSIVPVLSLGSLSKRWMLPGWRVGWIVITDPNGILQKYGILDSIKSCLDISPDPATCIQAAIPKILNIPEDFYSRTLHLLREAVDISYDRLREIPCFTCPYKPGGGMFIMVKLNLSLLEGIIDDMDFCLKLAGEESVTLLPGVAMGLKNWLRLTFAVELSSLQDGLQRIRAFCLRHEKKL